MGQSSLGGEQIPPPSSTFMNILCIVIKAVAISDQVTVWGDYGRMERKISMGTAQIVLNDINMQSMVIGWYKLFPHSNNSAETGSPMPHAIEGRRYSASSLESAYQSGSPAGAKM